MELELYALRCLRKKTTIEYSLETSPSTAASALRSSIIRLQELSSRAPPLPFNKCFVKMNFKNGPSRMIA
jgi:hypothetical protein